MTDATPVAQPAPRTVVVMGVSGSGKTTVGELLARRLGVVYAEADAFHPASNVAKMAAGVPLTDADRLPWLQAIAAWIGEQEQAGREAVVSCSALKRSYRDLLRDGHPGVWFLHLAGPEPVIAERISGRHGHFMPASLLDSQYADLQPLQPDEPGTTIDVTTAAEQVVDQALQALGNTRREDRGA